MQSVKHVIGVILAGGLARRMGGGDKALVAVGGRPLIDHVIARLRPQVAGLAIAANGDPARFAATGLPVWADPVPGFPGPLAGVLAGLDQAAAAGVCHVLTVPCDTPFLPADLAARLAAPLEAGVAEVAVAASAGRRHPVAALWPTTARAALRRALEQEGARKVEAFADRHDGVAVDFPVVATAAGPVDPFFNVNTPADRAEAERLLRALAPGPGDARR